MGRSSDMNIERNGGAKRIRNVPGVGPITASAIVATIRRIGERVLCNPFACRLIGHFDTASTTIDPCAVDAVLPIGLQFKH